MMCIYIYTYIYIMYIYIYIYGLSFMCCLLFRCSPSFFCLAPFLAVGPRARRTGGRPRGARAGWADRRAGQQVWGWAAWMRGRVGALGCCYRYRAASSCL